MKTAVGQASRLVVISLVFLLLASCLSFAELTKGDLQEIQKMFDKQKQEIKEYVKNEVRTAKAELMQEIIKVDAKIAKVDAKVDVVKGEVQSVRVEMKSVKDGQTDLKWFIGILAAIVIAGIALPTFLWAWLQRKKEKESEQMQRQLDQILTDFRVMQQEVDWLKKSVLSIDH